MKRAPIARVVLVMLAGVLCPAAWAAGPVQAQPQPGATPSATRSAAPLTQPLSRGEPGSMSAGMQRAPSSATQNAVKDGDLAEPAPTELERTPVFGLGALPKALYIVPWKKPPLGALAADAGAIDPLPAPIDAAAHRREVELHPRPPRASAAVPTASSSRPARSAGDPP